MEDNIRDRLFPKRIDKIYIDGWIEPCDIPAFVDLTITPLINFSLIQYRVNRDTSCYKLNIIALIALVELFFYLVDDFVKKLFAFFLPGWMKYSFSIFELIDEIGLIAQDEHGFLDNFNGRASEIIVFHWFLASKSVHLEVLFELS